MLPEMNQPSKPKRQRKRRAPMVEASAVEASDVENIAVPMSEQTDSVTQQSVAPQPPPEAERAHDQATVQTVTPAPAPIKKFNTRWWYIPIVLIGVLAALAYSAYRVRIVAGDKSETFFEQITPPLPAETNDRINVLLLGIGGQGHDGGTLTDTIMVASIKPSTHQVALLSLPRDLIVKIYDEGNPGYWEGRKINYAYALGGIPLATTKVEEVTGLKLHYYILLDFSGFRKVIDDVGGVNVTVDHALIGLYGTKDLSTPCSANQLYQLDDGPYCAITFIRGEQPMNGERALVFARVRKLAPNSPNRDEGSDFARAQRQQKILEGFKNKLFSAGTIIRPGRLTSVLNDIDQHLKTNLQILEMVRLLQLVGEVTSADIVHHVVDDSPGGLVMTKWYEPTAASIVVPTAGDYNYSGIQKVAKQMFKKKDSAESVTNETVATTTETVIQVLNGTATAGLAADTATRLEEQGFTVSGIGNAPTKDYTTTRMYDLTAGQNTAALEKIQTVIAGEVISDKAGVGLASFDPTSTYFDTTVDFIIILGTNASTTHP